MASGQQDPQIRIIKRTINGQFVKKVSLLASEAIVSRFAVLFRLTSDSIYLTSGSIGSQIERLIHQHLNN